MEYTLTSDNSWVGFSPASGYIESGYAQAQVNINRAALRDGVNTAIMQVATDIGESYEVEIVAWVGGADGTPAPTIEVSQNLLDFGNYANTQNFTLRNSGDGAIEYYIVADEGWAAVSPAEGENSGEIDTITVAVDRAQLAPGSHACPIRIATNDGLAREIWVLVREPEPEEPTEAQLLAWMQELEPLQKVHYSWALVPNSYRYGVIPLVREYVRLAHAASVSMEWVEAQGIDELVGLCKEINSTNPETPARLGLTHSPWHIVFPDGYPPTYTGPEHYEEIAIFQGHLEDISLWLDEANDNHNTNVEVGAILLDAEQFERKEVGEAGYEVWNAALNQKYDVIYDLCKEYFPAARVEWYGRGRYRRCAKPRAYCESNRFTYDEGGDSFSLSLYTITEPATHREEYRLTLAGAQAHGEESVTPWVALACGYKQNTESVDSPVWTWDWDFDLYYSWLAGAELNDPWYANQPDRFAPWDHADLVVFYPEAFGRITHWGKHFVAYVRGANGITELPE